jgi:hypothetical protein
VSYVGKGDATGELPEPERSWVMHRLGSKFLRFMVSPAIIMPHQAAHELQGSM